MTTSVPKQAMGPGPLPAHELPGRMTVTCHIGQLVPTRPPEDKAGVVHKEVLQPRSTGKALVEDVTDAPSPTRARPLQQAHFLGAFVAGPVTAIGPPLEGGHRRCPLETSECHADPAESWYEDGPTGWMVEPRLDTGEPMGFTRPGRAKIRIGQTLRLLEH